MDGWYVRQLFLDSNIIRSNIVNTYVVKEPRSVDEYDDDYENYLYYYVDVDNPSFEDLLLVESAFDTLYESGSLSDKEHVITLMMADNYSVKEISSKLKIKSRTVYMIFAKVSAKIAFYLGGYFTNEGFLDRICKKHSLTAKQINALNFIMEK
jgi:hypothetical protein